MSLFKPGRKITIATPCKGSVPVQTLVSILNLVKPEYYFVSNNFVPLDKSRNDLVAKFLCLHPDSDYILFFDSDIVAPRDALIRLLKRDEAIIGGLYFQKYPPFFPVAGCRVPREKTKAVHLLVQWKEGDLINVDALGMGFTLIRKDVFQEIEYPWFEFGELSEDFEFCYKAQRAGFKIKVDTTVICQHKSDTVFVDRDFYSMFQRQLLSTSITLEGKSITTLPVKRRQRI